MFLSALDHHGVAGARDYHGCGVVPDGFDDLAGASRVSHPVLFADHDECRALHGGGACECIVVCVTGPQVTAENMVGGVERRLQQVAVHPQAGSRMAAEPRLT